MGRYRNRGARELDAGLIRQGWTRQRGEVECGAASGQFSKIIAGKALPGRTLAIRIRDVISVPVEAYDQPDDNAPECQHGISLYADGSGCPECEAADTEPPADTEPAPATNDDAAE